MKKAVTVYCSPLSVHYQFTVIHDQWLIVNGKCTVNSKRKIVNGTGGAYG